ncbi:MAG: hypothetical protein K2N87_11510 [Eubacterium sp.]|nr:hypothetical protein [Eubacterium sp.]
MGQNQERQLTTDVTFEKTECTAPKTISTQEITDQEISSWMAVENCLWDMFEDADEFVVLTLEEIQHQIRYVQAAQIEDGIIVQLGIEEGDHTRLVEKACTKEECCEIFQEFYNSSYVQDVEQYKPVQFYV